MLKKLITLVLAVGLCLTFGLGTAKANVTVSEGRLGDCLLFPLYDVRETAERSDGWQNYLTIANTSPLWTAAHVRFRTWRKSIEVYDHIILLSPYDVFYIVIERQADGSVELRSEDTGTLLNSGLIYPPDTAWSTVLQSYLLEQCGYTAAAGYDLNAEMQAGYVEIIGLWQLSRTFPNLWTTKDTSDLSNVVLNLYDDGHVGNINVFDVLDGLFFNGNLVAAGAYAGLRGFPDWPWIAHNNHQDVTGITIIQGANEDPNVSVALPAGRPRYGVDCGNVLYATMALGDSTTSQYEMANFVALQDFRTENWTTIGGLAGPLHQVNNDGALLARSTFGAPTNTIHRDTHEFGAILFVADVMFWLPYDYLATAATSGFGIDPYNNENWATTVGPGLRDGDDLNETRGGTNLNLAPGANGQLQNWNQYVPPAPLPAVAWFNDIWSMDDVERVLMKNRMWYNYFNNAFGASSYQTDFNITFPTKHYHWFFRDWVFWNDSDIVPPFNNPYSNYSWTPTAPYPTVSNYWDAIGNYRGSDAEPNGAPANGSIATRFEVVYANGEIEAAATIWNMDEDTEAGGEPPPGSPWIPIALKIIPHEANIISVGANSGTGIEDANGVLYTGYDMGQFMVGNVTLRNGQRFTVDHALYDNDNDDTAGPYLLPEIGVMIFDLNYAGGDYRSTMAPWDYTLLFPIPDP